MKYMTILCLLGAILGPQVRAEDLTPARLLDPDSKTVIATGYLDKDDHFSIEQFQSEVVVSSDLRSSYASSLGASGFVKYCADTKYDFRGNRTLRRNYELKIKFPLLDGRRTYIAMTDRGPVTVDRNKIAFRLLQAHAKVKFENQSYLMMYGQLDPQIVSNLLDQQLQAQFTDIRASGEATIRLPGYDDVACDFVSGNVTLGVQTLWDFAVAKPPSITRLSGEQLEKIHIRARNGLELNAQTFGAALLAAGETALALRDETSMSPSQFGPGKFVTLFSVLFDAHTNTWKPLVRSDDYATLSHQFDDHDLKPVQGQFLLRLQHSGVITW